MQNEILITNEIGAQPAHNHKDNLFRYIFSGEDERSRGWLLSLYNALNNSNYTDSAALRITTIQNAIFMTMKDDLSFLIDSELNLYEHQSTVNPNMPLRGLMYFAKLYQMELSRRQLQLYGSTLVKIPSPRFIVFYNGTTKQDDVIKYRLSNAFEKPANSGEFEWTATVININQNHNPVLQKKCKALYDYSSFVANVRLRLSKGESTADAVKNAVDDAINNRLLDGLFKEQKQEIIGLSLTEFDQEAYEKTIRAEGIAEGQLLKAIESATELLKENVTPEVIAKCVKLPLEKVLELQKQITA